MGSYDSGSRVSSGCCKGHVAQTYAFCISKVSISVRGWWLIRKTAEQQLLPGVDIAACEADRIMQIILLRVAMHVPSRALMERPSALPKQAFQIAVRRLVTPTLNHHRTIVNVVQAYKATLACLLAVGD